MSRYARRLPLGLRRGRLAKRVTVHTLRHSFARFYWKPAPLLEAGTTRVSTGLSGGPYPADREPARPAGAGGRAARLGTYDSAGSFGLLGIPSSASLSSTSELS